MKQTLAGASCRVILATVNELCAFIDEIVQEQLTVSYAVLAMQKLFSIHYSEVWY